MTNEASVPADFDFSRLQIEEAVAWFPMPLVSPKAALCVSPIVGNRRMTDAALALAGRQQRIAAGGGDITRAALEADRADDLQLYPRFVVKNWRGITNKAGQDVPCTPENVAAFLRALPTWMFDRLRAFCGRPENFVEQAPPSAEAIAPN